MSHREERRLAIWESTGSFLYGFPGGGGGECINRVEGIDVIKKGAGEHHLPSAS